MSYGVWERPLVSILKVRRPFPQKEMKDLGRSVKELRMSGKVSECAGKVSECAGKVLQMSGKGYYTDYLI